MEFEIKIIEFLQSGRTPFFDIAFQVISLMGSFMGVILVSIFFLIFKPRLALWYGGTYSISILISTILKNVIKRTRPYNLVETIANIGANEHTFSLPSGHINSAFIMAVFLGIFLFSLYKTKGTRILIVLSLAVYVGLVAISRMYLGKHYLTDLLLGLAVAGVVTAVFLVMRHFVNKKRRILYENPNGNT